MESNAARLVGLLKEKNFTITTAESLTGGAIAKEITSVSGSSAVFPGGVVSYCDRIKHEVLQVPQSLLDEHGAVSEPVAKAMAQGAAKLMGTDLAVSATGLAGPEGDGSENPVGTVYLGLYAGGKVYCEHHVFSGGRESVRRQSAERAVGMALAWLEDSTKNEGFLGANL